MEEQLTPLRFGIMVDDLVMEAWKVETIHKLIKGGMQLAFIIRNAEPMVKKTFFQRLKDLPVRRAMFQVWNHYWFKPVNKQMIDLSSDMKEWNQNFDEVVLPNGYKINTSDKCVYSKYENGPIICLYVDDILIYGTSLERVEETKHSLSHSFTMKDMG